MAGLEQFAGYHAADVAGAAGNQYSHRSLIPVASADPTLAVEKSSPIREPR
jgi:hypothetical protein